MLSEKEKIDLITRISLDINEAKDIDLLLERILCSDALVNAFNVLIQRHSPSKSC